MRRKLILYIATSLDGFIAAKGDDLSFLNSVMKEGEDYGYASFTANVDTVIVGRRTYDWVMEQVDAWPHADKDSYIITHQEREGSDKLHFYTGNVQELVEKLKAQDGLNIYCDGGGGLVTSLLKEQLFDELIISVIPTLLGDGVRLIQDIIPQTQLKLLDARSYATGLVQMHYAVVK